MPQLVKIHSHRALANTFYAVEQIDVQGCECFREEDKANILDSVTNIDAFNARLQWLIFGTEGLISKWMDGMDRASVVGRVAARAFVRANRHGDDLAAEVECRRIGMTIDHPAC